MRWREGVHIIFNSGSKKVNRWKRAIKRGVGRDWDFLQSVINDAAAKKTQESYSKYYQCAKFIRDYYYETEFKYKKEPIMLRTCCKAYPDICGGICCSGNVECQCDIMSDKLNKIGNCRYDCCAIYETRHSRKFTIKWL